MPRLNKVPEPTLKVSARIEERVCEAVARYTGDRADKPSQAQAINESLQWWVAAQENRETVERLKKHANDTGKTIEAATVDALKFYLTCVDRNTVDGIKASWKKHPDLHIKKPNGRRLQEALARGGTKKSEGLVK